jgi:hypothetical protein
VVQFSQKASPPAPFWPATLAASRIESVENPANRAKRIRNLFILYVERHLFMKLDEAIQKAREKLQNPAAKAAVQGEIHYLGVLTEVEMNQRANPGNAPYGDCASEGKAVVAFGLNVSAVQDRAKATPEEAFEAAKVIVFDAVQGQRENKAGFANCLRALLDRKVEASRS